MLDAVVMHSKPNCPFCVKAERLLHAIGVSYTKVLYDPANEGYEAARDALFEANGHPSFPQVFVGGMFLGGFAELRAAHASERLDRMLVSAGVDTSDCF